MGLWTDVIHIDNGDGIGDVDERGLDLPSIADIEDIANITRRQQLSSGRARGIEKSQLDRRARPRDAVDPVIALDFCVAVLHRESRNQRLAGVGVEDADSCLLSRRGHQAFIERERTDSRTDVTAVGAVADDRLVDAHLRKRVVDIDARSRGTGDHSDLRERGNSAAHSVELTFGAVRAAHQ